MQEITKTEASFKWDSHKLKWALKQALDGCIVNRKFKILILRFGQLEVI
jgi:hypothetical protein